MKSPRDAENETFRRHVYDPLCDRCLIASVHERAMEEEMTCGDELDKMERREGKGNGNAAVSWSSTRHDGRSYSRLRSPESRARLAVKSAQRLEDSTKN